MITYENLVGRHLIALVDGAQGIGCKKGDKFLVTSSKGHCIAVTGNKASTGTTWGFSTESIIESEERDGTAYWTVEGEGSQNYPIF